MKSSFLIVADRGNVKAYRLEHIVEGRPPRVKLVQGFSLVDPHQRLGETMTDQAGSFQMSEGGGRHPNSAGERHLDIERDRRTIRQLATHITEILRQEQPGYWAFAAPAEIQHAIFEELRPEVRELAEETIHADLVNTPATELLSHFSAIDRVSV
ncbi:MAG: hypothetical protein JWL59_2597 [Chthoniobacteraceae bacterium]|nr:hypothetical protein [Chthoniobacteraceae bacterium]